LNFVKDPANSVLSVAILDYTYDYLNVTPPGTTGQHFNRYRFDGVFFKEIIPTLSFRYGISKINVDDVNGLNDIKSINGIDDAFIYEVNGIVS
jgi:hypothetical protein